ncbi:hypothetical protein AAEX63_08775 [Luteococcus sp. H138]|uniref:hypothetical protein n=1 Tax=unclassified Luteococcus TaxID=2639923 RepID=UPI00313B165F
MSQIDEGELRRLLGAVDPVGSDASAARAVTEARGRLRRRRLALGLVAILVGLAVLVTTLVVVHRSRDDQTRLESLSTPSATAPSPLPAVGAEQLPTASDLAPMGTYSLPLGQPVDHPDGLWGGSPTLCQPHPQLGQESLRVREFKDARVTAAVLGFSSPQDATAARQRILGWYRDCGRHAGTVDEWTGKTLPVQQPAFQPVVAVVANPSWKAEGENAQARHEESVIVQVGNRLTWLSQVGGEEQNCGLTPSDTVGACGAFASAQAVATRLSR